MYTLHVAILAVVCAVAFGYRGHYDGMDDYNMIWPLARRSRLCGARGDKCLMTSQCCPPNTCVVYEFDSFPYKRMAKMGMCQNIERDMDRMDATKPEGARCEDSSECTDLCCRKIRYYRYTSKVCGKNDGPFMCIRKSKDSNDIFGK